MIRQRAHKPAGFTLVELMVALGLTIFLLALFTSLMVAATGSINTSQGIGAVDQQVRNAVTILRDDLQHVYLANGGTQLRVSELFTNADKIPSKGYFLIEENDRAVRQGLDSSGLPVEVDFDDVLAFTAGNPAGTKREDFYYGRVYNSKGTTILNDPHTDLGNYLDNSFNDPVKSFDTPGNNLISSRFAEIVYFLRANGRQYSVDDIRGSWPAGASPTIPPTPPTFTLYRRQLLVLENGNKLNRGSSIAPDGINLVSATGGRSFYELFDISASRELAIVPGNAPTDNINGAARIHFNTLEDLSQREYRYGMQLFYWTLATPINSTLIRALPLSHQVANGTISVHRNPFVLDQYTKWYGRPTQEETNNPNYPFSPLPLASNQDLVITDTTPEDAVIDAYAKGATQSYRYGDDVLLTNVVSFDVKVFEDNVIPPSAETGATYATASASLNPLDDAVSKARNAVGPSNIPTLGTIPLPQSRQILSRVRRPEFVDLGYGYDRTDLIGGTLLPADIANCQTLNNYYYHPTLASFGLPFNPAFDALHPGMDMSITGTDGIYMVNGPNNLEGDNDDFKVAAFPAPLNTVANLDTLLTTAKGPDGFPGQSGDDDGDSTPENIEEYLSPFSDDVSVFIEAPYYKSGQIGDNVNAVDLWGVPRNTYDSWSDAPAYSANPRFPLSEQSGGITASTLNPNFRPVPYPRPLKGIQIKLRVLEPKTGIVRDFTLRHYFD